MILLNAPRCVLLPHMQQTYKKKQKKKKYDRSKEIHIKKLVNYLCPGMKIKENKLKCTSGLVFHLNLLHLCWKYVPLEAGSASSLLPEQRKQPSIRINLKRH